MLARELAGAVANPMTSDVGRFTGLSLPRAVFAQTQRGYRDNGPPDAASAFQLGCSGADFYIDSRRFAHALAGTRLAMLAAGWKSEGYGPQGVAMCSPDAGTGAANFAST